jgi:hypothetical protein
MRLASSVVLLVLGLALPLLLDGQTFTNGLLGIGCASGACALGMSIASQKELTATKRFHGRLIGVLGALVIVLLAVTLRGAYREQRAFNRLRGELHRKVKAAELKQIVAPLPAGNVNEPR